MPQQFDPREISTQAKAEIAKLLGIHPDIRPLLFGAGELIVREGDTSQEVYVVLDGDYSVQKAPMFPEAPPIVLASVSCGPERVSILGEMAYLSGEGIRRTASVKALTDLRALRLEPHHIDAVIEQCPSLTRVLCRQFVQRIRALNEQIRQLEGADFCLESLEIPLGQGES